MHDMEMELPGGLALADRRSDRDGLELDVLRVFLGPLLALWPGGLRLDLTVQGDVVQEASVLLPDEVGGRHGSFWREPWVRALAGEPVFRREADQRCAAAALDSTGRLLHLAGARALGLRCAILRDRILADGAPPGATAVAVRGVAHAVRRSRLLHAMLREVPSTGGADAWSSLVDRLSVADEALRRAVDDGDELLDALARPPQADDLARCAALPELVVGQEVGTVRLVGGQR